MGDNIDRTTICALPEGAYIASRANTIVQVINGHTPAGDCTGPRFINVGSLYWLVEQVSRGNPLEAARFANLANTELEQCGKQQSVFHWVLVKPSGQTQSDRLSMALYEQGPADLPPETVVLSTDQEGELASRGVTHIRQETQLCPPAGGLAYSFEGSQISTDNSMAGFQERSRVCTMPKEHQNRPSTYVKEQHRGARLLEQMQRVAGPEQPVVQMSAQDLADFQEFKKQRTGQSAAGPSTTFNNAPPRGNAPRGPTPYRSNQYPLERQVSQPLDAEALQVQQALILMDHLKDASEEHRLILEAAPCKYMSAKELHILARMSNDNRVVAIHYYEHLLHLSTLRYPELAGKTRPVGELQEKWQKVMSNIEHDNDLRPPRWDTRAYLEYPPFWQRVAPGNSSIREPDTAKPVAGTDNTPTVHPAHGRNIASVEVTEGMNSAQTESWGEEISCDPAEIPGGRTSIHPYNFGLTKRVFSCSGALMAVIGSSRASLWQAHQGAGAGARAGVVANEPLPVHDFDRPNGYDWKLHDVFMNTLQFSHQHSLLHSSLCVPVCTLNTQDLKEPRRIFPEPSYAFSAVEHWLPVPGASYPCAKSQMQFAYFYLASMSRQCPGCTVLGDHLQRQTHSHRGITRYAREKLSRCAAKACLEAMDEVYWASKHEPIMGMTREPIGSFDHQERHGRCYPTDAFDRSTMQTNMQDCCCYYCRHIVLSKQRHIREAQDGPSSFVYDEQH